MHIFLHIFMKIKELLALTTIYYYQIKLHFHPTHNYSLTSFDLDTLLHYPGAVTGVDWTGPQILICSTLRVGLFTPSSVRQQQQQLTLLCSSLDFFHFGINTDNTLVDSPPNFEATYLNTPYHNFVILDSTVWKQAVVLCVYRCLNWIPLLLIQTWHLPSELLLLLWCNLWPRPQVRLQMHCSL